MSDAVARFRRVLLFNMGLLIVVGIAVALSAIWLGWSVFLVGLLLLLAANVLYLLYLVRRFTKRTT